MFRRTLLGLIVVLAMSAARAEAVTVRDVIELSKAGLSESVLLALIEVDHAVYTLDAPTLKELKQAGVSEAVIIAMIRSGRPVPTPPEAQPQPAPEPAPASEPAPQPQVIVIDHHDTPAPQPVAYPVAVPVYVPVVTNPYYGAGRRGGDRVTTTFETDQGIVKARVPVPPNCVKAEPVYWGFGGKLRPGSWEPPPTVVCR